MENITDESTKIIKRSFRPGKKTIATALLVVVIGTLAYYYKDLFIAATVNGSPISRLTVIKKLESMQGKEALQSIITDTLINKELDKNNKSASQEEIEVKIKQIEESVKQQGNTLEAALAAEGLTMEEFRKQIETQVRIEKLLADKAQVTDEEVNEYITANKIEIPNEGGDAFREQVKNQLKSQKFNQVANEWVTSLQSAAAINYYKEY